MRKLATVLLLHETAQGRHYDWLIEDPLGAEGEAPLWTARVDRPTGAWANAGEMILQALPPHRRVYLEYEGPISGNRGTVRRVDRGYAAALAWGPALILLDVHFEHYRGRVELLPLPAGGWRARMSPAAGGPDPSEQAGAA